MTAQVKNICIVVSVAGIVVTAIWYYETRLKEPLAALIFAIGALIALVFTKNSKDPKSNKTTFKQKGGDDSEQYQAGRDLNIKK